MALGKLIGKIAREIVFAPLEAIDEFGKVFDPPKEKEKPKK